MPEYMLSTVDNPYNPFKEWDAWYAFDEASGYNTTAFLARIVKSSDELSETDQRLAIESAIDEIVYENVNGMYIKVTENSETSKDRERIEEGGEGSRESHPPVSSPAS